jgi:outer membrane protein insertion porin family
MKKGDVFSTEKLRNGLKNLTKVYSQFGYIDYVGEPQIDIEPNSNKIDLTLNADEGKQFFVRRIDFTGNTTTRDKVIRRQILIDEGDVYNSTLWDASILRLNQLGYFEALKENEAYTAEAQRGHQHGRYHSEGERTRQEFHQPERRRFGHRRNVRRPELLDQ